MTWQTIYAAALLLISGSVAFTLAIIAWRQRSNSWTVPFSIMLIGSGVWSTGYAAELVLSTLAQKILMSKVQYIGISAIPVAWFLFAVAYLGRTYWLQTRWVLPLSSISIVTIILTMTNEWHGLIWQGVMIDSSGPLNVGQFSYGAAWYGFFVYSYLLLLAGSMALILSIWNNSRKQKQRMYLLLLAPLMPWVANILYLLDVSPIPQLDLTPFAFLISGLILNFGALRLNIFAIEPIARSLVVERSDSAMLVLDRQDRVVDINPAGMAMFAIKNQSSVIGSKVTVVLNILFETLAQYLDTTATNTEFAATVRGEERFFNLQIQPLFTRQGTQIGRVFIIKDITSDKVVDQAVAMAKAKTELMAKVGHELRTPLNGIMGMAEMLDFGVYGEMSEEQKGALTNIVDRAKHLATLVDDLLDQNRMAHSQYTLHITRFSLADLINRVRETESIKAQEKDIAFNITLDPELPAMIQSDPTRLYQILINLIDNAIKFTKTGFVRVTFSKEGENSWSIRVRDTGIGIPESKQAYIFAPFQQAHYSITREETGLGLGLSIVKQLVNLLQGKIQIKSKSGLGSTFIVTLPLNYRYELEAPTLSDIMVQQ